MPPKKKAAATKAAKPVQNEDPGAGGDKLSEPDTTEAKPAKDEKKEPPKRRGRAPKKVVEPEKTEEPNSEAEEMEEEPKKVIPKKRGRKPANGDVPKEEEPPAPKRRGRAPAKKNKKEEEDEKVDEKDEEVEQKSDNDDEKEEENEEPKKKRGRKAAAAAAPKEKKTKEKVVKEKAEKPVKEKKEKETKTQNKTSTDYESIDFDSCPRKNENGNSFNFKIATWNVDGIRALIDKDGLTYIQKENADIICLQETKASEEKLPEPVKNIEGYKAYWAHSTKSGYAGVGLLTKEEPISVKEGIGNEDQDEDGRCLTAEFEKFYVISVYVPNAGRKLVTLPKRLEWNDLFKNYVKELDKKKPVIICGDMNVAHNEIDLKNPKTNKKNAGFTQEERDGMTEFLKDGYIDVFRDFYPEKEEAFTFWTYMANARSKNIGWRLDYFLVSERYKENICDTMIRSNVFGSDHCPIVLFLEV